MPKFILVIEDDSDIQIALQDGLDLAGFQVKVASNGQEALDLLKQGDLPCLILLDLMMPVMDGWEFRKRQENDSRIAKIPVVVVTADGHAKIKAHKMHVQDGISKPVDFDVLFKVAQTYCG